MIRKRMTETPLVSVIVPVYNVAAYFPACIASVRAQTYPAMEVILVDDGSTDESGRMCDEEAAEDARITVLHKENGGLMSAWIAGANLAKGAYLCFVDGDDWIDRELIEALAKEASDPDSDTVHTEILCCNYLIERSDGSRQERRHRLSPGVYEGRELEEKLLREIVGHGERTVILSRCMKLISAELIRRNLKYCDPSLKMGEDVNIMLPAFLDSKRVVLLKNTYWYHYRYLDDSMVHKHDDGLDENISLLTAVIRRILEEKFHGEALRHMNVSNEEIEAMVQKEHLVLFRLQLKNELRSDAPDVTGRIQALCKRENIEALTKRFPVEAHGFAEKLLYNIEKKPTLFRIRMAKRLYDLRH